IDYNLLKQVRRDYVQNMVESDYVLCCRGLGNYSFRLYEALSCGRIPVLINTDCVLPYDFWIDYKDYCIWVEEREISDLPEIVADFHARLSPQAFIAHQQNCRALWEHYLSPRGFFSNLHRHLQDLGLISSKLCQVSLRP
ncbi:MAG: exostosin family protein, partial [Synechococcales bacterium]|nr:exostosin family protein [Synechococcales bacterium]